MNDEYTNEMLERLGYDGARLEAMQRYLKEFQRRLNIVEGGCLSASDIVSASIIFDGFNRKGTKGK